MLGSKEIKRRIQFDRLVWGFKDFGKQLQPNGFDLTVKEVHAFRNQECSIICVDSKRHAQIDPVEKKVIGFNGEIGWFLHPGIFVVIFNETVKIPNDLCAMTIQRSTLMRNGATTAVGFWDSGYQGQGQTLLTIGNTMRLEENSRIVQMVFAEVDKDQILALYNGSYQNERLNNPE